MGYSTTFQGSIHLSRPLTRSEARTLTEFSKERHDDGVFPSIHCDFAPNDAGDAIVWNGMEKTYEAVDWIQTICDDFLDDWDIVANGELVAYGSRPGDIWILRVVDNVASRHEGRVTVA